MRQPPQRPPIVWASFLLFWVFGTLAAVWPLPGSAAACLLFSADRRLWQTGRLILACLVFLLATAYAGWEFQRFEQTDAPSWATGAKPVRLTARIISTQTLPDCRARMLLADVRPLDCPNAAPLPGLCLWTWTSPPLNLQPMSGQTVHIKASPKRVRGIEKGAAQSWDAFIISQGVYWRLWSKGNGGDPAISGKPLWTAELRMKLRRQFIRALSLPDTECGSSGKPETSAALQAKAMLLALLFGDRFYLSRDTMAKFSAAALAHSLALSGQHLCVAGFLGMLAILSLARCHSGIYLKRPRMILAIAASLPLALLYLWLGNAPSSLIRAAFMLFILALWLWRGTVFCGIDLLCAALLAILVFWPLAMLDTGLQLSALCIAVIIISLPALARIWPETQKGRQKISSLILIRSAQIFMTSLLIQLALLPVTLLKFHTAGFWFPLNVLWLPVLGFFILPVAVLGLILASCAFATGMFPAQCLLDLAAWPCELILKSLSALEHAGFLSEPAFLLPHWSSLPAFGLLAAALAWVFGNNRESGAKAAAMRLIFTALLCLFTGPALRLLNLMEGGTSIEILDVGQGESICINLPESKRLLLDGGGSFSSSFDPGKNIVAPALSANKPPLLAAVVNTHPDMDHLGGLFHILDNFKVNLLFHNGRDAANEARASWQEIQKRHGAIILRAGDTLLADYSGQGLALETLHPPAGGQWLGNSASIVLRLCQNGVGLVLFTGDAEKDTLKYLLATGADLRAKALIAPHHGSDRSFYPAFYEAVQPEVVIASCGFQNRWNYPGKKIRLWFAKKGIPVLDTGNNGSICLQFDSAANLKIGTSRHHSVSPLKR